MRVVPDAPNVAMSLFLSICTRRGDKERRRGSPVNVPVFTVIVELSCTTLTGAVGSAGSPGATVTEASSALSAASACPDHFRLPSGQLRSPVSDGRLTSNAVRRRTMRGARSEGGRASRTRSSLRVLREAKSVRIAAREGWDNATHQRSYQSLPVPKARRTTRQQASSPAACHRSSVASLRSPRAACGRTCFTARCRAVVRECVRETADGCSRFLWWGVAPAGSGGSCICAAGRPARRERGHEQEGHEAMAREAREVTSAALKPKCR